MTQEELRTALLDALFEYETLKKTRRIKALKKALRGTVMATVIGSAGLTAANGESRNNPTGETVVAMATSMNALPTRSTQESIVAKKEIFKGVALFALNQHELTSEHEIRLAELIKLLPKDAEISVIGRTDSLGVQHINKKLGKLRAAAVAEFMAQHGVKIKAVGSRPSKNKHHDWRERRVDVIVNSVATNVAANVPGSVYQLPIEHAKAEPKVQKPLSAVDYHDALLNTLQENDKNRFNASKKNSEAVSKPIQQEAKIKPEYQGNFRHKVSGATHFALNQHTLTAAHKERLLELIKQLPKDAELTVIGRTDGIGGDDDNNKTLGMQRAKSVAIFLANQGVKVKAVGSKVSSNQYSGWLARRVDIIVDSSLDKLPINLPLPFAQKPVLQNKVRPINHARYISSINAIKHKRLLAIEQNVMRLIEGARYQFNANQIR